MAAMHSPESGLRFPRSDFDAYFGVPTRVLSGPGKIAVLGEELALRGLDCVMVFTDKGLADGEFVESACASMRAAGVEVVVEAIAEPDPTVELMDTAASLIGQKRCSAVVGIGGGSSLDLAKAAAIGVSTGKSVRALVGVDQVPSRSTFVVAVPTTVGTGSEVSWHISVRDAAAEKKVTIRSVYACPDLAILDAHAVKSLPRKLAGITAADSFTHLYESLISNKGSWILTDGLALAGIKALVESIGPFLENSGNEAAGQNVLEAAMLGGMVLSHARTGVVHQMARPLGAVHHIAHGLANAIVLPRAVNFLVERIPDKMAKVYEGLRAMDEKPLPPQSDVFVRAQRVSDLVSLFILKLDLPDHLGACGVIDVDAQRLAHDALQGQVQVENPCVIQEEDVIEMYRACCSPLTRAA